MLPVQLLLNTASLSCDLYFGILAFSPASTQRKRMKKVLRRDCITSYGKPTATLTRGKMMIISLTSLLHLCLIHWPSGKLISPKVNNPHLIYESLVHQFLLPTIKILFQCKLRAEVTLIFLKFTRLSGSALLESKGKQSVQRGNDE